MLDRAGPGHESRRARPLPSLWHMTTTTTDRGVFAAARSNGIAPIRAEVLVVGAGQSGLAVSAMLRRRGIEPTIVSRDPVGNQWRNRWDKLHLHTHRLFSGLPGLRIAGTAEPWVAKERFAAYLQNYADFHQLEPRSGVTLERLDRSGDGWRVQTSAGPIEARIVVIATGFLNTPRVPDWPGKDSFEGELIHSFDYRTTKRFAGRDVLVVGAGNSGTEIALELAQNGVGRLWNSIRTPPHIIPRNIGRIPITVLTIPSWRLPRALMDWPSRLLQRKTIGDLSGRGVPTPREGLYTHKQRDHEHVPIMDTGWVDQVKSGRVKVVAAVERFEGRKVVLSDGSTVEPDAVIAATGYHRGLDGIAGHLGIVGTDNGPQVREAGNEHPGAPGLYFIGYLNSLNGAMWQQSIEARRVARTIAKRLRGRRTPAR
jgi:putative flavoprotein involved in K+ transport